MSYQSSIQTIISTGDYRVNSPDSIAEALKLTQYTTGSKKVQLLPEQSISILPIILQLRLLCGMHAMIQSMMCANILLCRLLLRCRGTAEVSSAGCHSATSSTHTVDKDEVHRFSQLSSKWYASFAQFIMIYNGSKET